MVKYLEVTERNFQECYCPEYKRTLYLNKSDSVLVPINLPNE